MFPRFSLYPTETIKTQGPATSEFTRKQQYIRLYVRQTRRSYNGVVEVLLKHAADWGKMATGRVAA